MATITSAREAAAELEEARRQNDEHAARLELIRAQVEELNAHVLECLTEHDRLVDEAGRRES